MGQNQDIMMARNLIALPVELQEEFAHNLKTRGPKKNEPCFAWYVKDTDLGAYLLCCQQMGYLLLVDKDVSLDVAISEEIEVYSELDLPVEHFLWGGAASYPKPVKKRLNKGLAAIRHCTDLGEAEDEIWKLNLEPYAIGKKKFPPEDAFEGYFTEVREDAERYFRNMGPMAKLWHMISSRFPWN